jgi:hypothetical protein
MEVIFEGWRVSWCRQLLRVECQTELGFHGCDLLEKAADVAAIKRGSSLVGTSKCVRQRVRLLHQCETGGASFNTVEVLNVALAAPR